MKLSQMPPGAVAFLEAANTTAYQNQTFYNHGTSDSLGAVDVRHDKTFTFLYYDGSVRSMPLASWAQKAQETTANELWCYLGSPDGR